MIKNFLFVLLTIGLLCGCKKEEVTRNPHFSVKIDGEFRETKNVSVSIQTGHQRVFTGIMIVGEFNDNEEVTLSLNDRTAKEYKVIKYALGNPDAATLTFRNGTLITENYYSATQGSATLTLSDKDHIKGTFHFEGENGKDGKKTLTEGKFEVWWPGRDNIPPFHL